MTAIVGVLNKHAVAIAADSAVTIGGKRFLIVLIKSSLFQKERQSLLQHTIMQI